MAAQRHRQRPPESAGAIPDVHVHGRAARSPTTSRPASAAARRHERDGSGSSSCPRTKSTPTTPTPARPLQVERGRRHGYPHLALAGGTKKNWKATKPVTATPQCSSTSAGLRRRQRDHAEGPGVQLARQPRPRRKGVKDGSDIYFYSPELLDPNNAGDPGQQNSMSSVTGRSGWTGLRIGHRTADPPRIQAPRTGDGVGLVAPRAAGCRQNGKG